MASEGPTQDDEFWLDDQMVVLQAENQLFRVHPFFLSRDSEVFEDMFSVPPVDGSTEGKTEDNPIILPDVTAFEMKCLLGYLYGPRKYDLDTLSYEELIALLSVSSRFMFQEIREAVIEAFNRTCDYPLYEALEPDHRCHICDRKPKPATKVVLASQYDIRMWILPAYFALCERESPLSVEEAIELGVTTTATIAQIREETLRHKDGIEKECSSCGASWERRTCVCGQGARAQDRDVVRKTQAFIISKVVDAFQLATLPED